MTAHDLVSANLRELGSHALDALRTTAEGRALTDDAEAIHDLRVALRRLRSTLRPVRALYGKHALDALEAKLAHALDTTSELRDEEVLRETLATLLVGTPARARLESWMIGRARRERGLRNRTLALLRTAIGEHDGVLAGVTAFDRRIERGARRHVPAGPFIASAIDDAVDVVDERAASASGGDALAMHRVRIACKRLRYTAALLGGATAKREGSFVPAHRALAVIEKASTRIQKRLGTLHDLDVGLVRLGRAWGLDPRVRGEVIAALGEARAREAHVSMDELGKERPRIDAARAAIDMLFPREPPPNAPDDAFADAESPPAASFSDSRDKPREVPP